LGSAVRLLTLRSLAYLSHKIIDGFYGLGGF
jgi:hypothetical protein